MEVFAQRLLRQYEELKSQRGTWDNQWQQIADYGLGRRDFTTHNITGGRPRQNLIYDATFQQSSDMLSAALQSLLVNSAARWYTLRPEDPRLLEDDDVAAWYEDATEQTYFIFNHPESSFAPQIHETLLDIVSFGTGCMYEEEEPGAGIVFQARPLSEIMVAESAYGRVDTVYRRFMLTSRQAYEQWGDDAGEKVKKAYDDGKFNEKFEFCHAVLPRSDTQGYRLSNRNLPIASIYLSCADKRIISERGYHEMPYQVARWSKDAGELYGRGPGINALVDAKMLNRMARTLLVAAEKATDPPMLVVDDGVLSPVRTQPGGVNVVRAAPGGQEPLRYLENRARPDLSQERFQAVREQVQGHFYNELIQTFSDPRMTATQVLELSARTAQRIGPMLFRLQVELLEPMITRIVGLADRGGYFLPKPAAMEGMPIRVDYVSPAAKAQLNSDVQGILTAMDTAMQWGQVWPDVIDNVDHDEAYRQLVHALGDTSKILRPNREVADIRATKNAEAERAEQMAQMSEMAQAAGKAAPALQAITGGRQ